MSFTGPSGGWRRSGLDSCSAPPISCGDGDVDGSCPAAAASRCGMTTVAASCSPQGRHGSSSCGFDRTPSQFGSGPPIVEARALSSPLESTSALKSRNSSWRGSAESLRVPVARTRSRCGARLPRSFSRCPGKPRGAARGGAAGWLVSRALSCGTESSAPSLPRLTEAGHYLSLRSPIPHGARGPRRRQVP